MNIFVKKCKDSFKELKNLNSLVGISMLLALSVALSFFSIELGPSIKIGPGFIVTALLGMIYGPIAGGVAAGTGDIIKYIIKPTGAYFPGFTLTAILGGFIYGLFFYKNRCSITKSIISKLIVNLFLNVSLNTFWISIIGGKAFNILITPRILKNLISLPIEIMILYFVLSRVSIILAKTQKQHI